MSKKDEIKNITNSIVSGFIAPQTDDVEDTPKKSKEIVNISTADISSNSKLKNTKNKNNNYTITFKIDADIEDYLKNIDKITFIESVKSGKIESITKTEFVNNLIREQFYTLIGATNKDDADTISSKWIEYKDKNNL